MQIYHELNKNENLSLAFGFFDGVHLAHKAVIKSAVDFAQKNGEKSAILTFSEHPHCYFYSDEPKYILSFDEKIKIFEDMGIDYLYLLDFKDYVNVSAQEYL